MAPVKWMGHRRIDCSRHPEPHEVWPVRVAAGAFGVGLPRRDLWLSPDHAVYAHGVLIPVKHLINGMTIEQVPMEEVSYYHIELNQHDILHAEGVPAESYLDTGDRSKFTNGGGPIALHPNFSVRMWEAKGCAPRVVTGLALTSVRAGLLQRAAQLMNDRQRSATGKSCAADPRHPPRQTRAASFSGQFVTPPGAILESLHTVRRVAPISGEHLV
jgi:hypothetical protein